MNFKETKSIYLQIADRIADEILQGKYGEGERIPSVREYAAEVEVNVNTMVRSYERLQQEGIIFNRRGLGYFVADGAKDTIRKRQRNEFVEETLPELFATMDRLGISIDQITEIYKRR